MENPKFFFIPFSRLFEKAKCILFFRFKYLIIIIIIIIIINEMDGWTVWQNPEKKRKPSLIFLYRGKRTRTVSQFFPLKITKRGAQGGGTGRGTCHIHVRTPSPFCRHVHHHPNKWLTCNPPPHPQPKRSQMPRTPPGNVGPDQPTSPPVSARVSRSRLPFTINTPRPPDSNVIS